MADFSTWDRATLEQFAQEATDKLVAMAEAQPVAWRWKWDTSQVTSQAPLLSDEPNWQPLVVKHKETE